MMRLATMMVAAALMFAPAAAGADKPKKSFEPAVSTLRVKVTDFRNKKGKLRVALYRSASGFSGDPKRAYRTASVSGKSKSVLFRDLPRGVYAVSVLHDENSNARMDTNWVGIPKEGGGASRNPKVRFGPPNFKQAAFSLNVERAMVPVRLRYP